MTPDSTVAELTLPADGRVLILAPHPDDETIATGGIIQRALSAGLEVHVVFYTNGDNNEWSFVVYRKGAVMRSKSIQAMGLVRHDEGLAAAKALGLREDQCTFLGYPDFGTGHIWAEHWGDRPPFRSMLTRVTEVPYQNAYRPGAPYRADEILRDLESILREFRPTVIFVSHPADHNPDHSALYLFTRVALWNLEKEMRPDVHPFLVHWPDWPKLMGYHPEVHQTPPALPERQAWFANPLSVAELAVKTEALHAHKSQYDVSTAYLESFLRPEELFGDLPPLEVGHEPSGDADRRGGEALKERIASALTHEERARFVGLERRAIWIEGDLLVCSVQFSRPLGKQVGATINAFGYRFDKPFGQMPKLKFEFGEIGEAVFDNGQKLDRSPAKFEHTARGMTLRIPLSFMGDPEWLLGNAQTHMGDLPLDWAAWRALKLRGA